MNNQIAEKENDEKSVKRDIITIVARTSLSVYFPYVIYNYFA